MVISIDTLVSVIKELSHQDTKTNCNQIVLTGQEWALLSTAAQMMPDVDWRRNALTLEQEQYCYSFINQEAWPLHDLFASFQINMAQDGACIVSLGAASVENEEALKCSLAIIASSACRPFGAFLSKGFWQTLGVNTQAKNLRADSTGYIPFHMDLDQASAPPEFSGLCCVRPDPLGGGENLIVDYRNLLGNLSEVDFKHLEAIDFSYSTLYQTYDLGHLQNPHPLIDRNLQKNGEWQCRYNGKARPQFVEHSKEAVIFDALEEIFQAASIELLLEPGDFLLMDQRRVLHARKPLSTRNNEIAISPDKDRRLLQIYGRHLKAA